MPESVRARAVWLPALLGGGLLLLAGCGSSPAGPAGGGGRARLGVNLDAVSSDSAEHLFADLVRQSREFYQAGAPWGTLAPLDDAGWPTTDLVLVYGTAGAHLASSQPYRLSFTGSAASITHSLGAVQNVVYDPATGTTTADVLVSSADNGYLTLTGTYRRADHAADAGGHVHGVTDLRLLRPGHTAADLFSHELLASLSQFGAVRPHVGIQGVNGAGQTLAAWSDRVLPGSPLQTFYDAPQAGYGMAWEYLVLLANQAGVDLYLTLPYRLTDDHVTRLAQLLRYGSDGVNPYPAPVEHPAYPPLAPGRTVYVEYVNEVWNGIFWTTSQMIADATAEYEAGDPYHYASDDPYLRMSLRLARRTVELSGLFRAVFGGEMDGRVRMVIGCQMANDGYFADQMYRYIEAVYGPSNPYGNPGAPVSSQVQLFAPANYLPDVPGPATADDVFAAWGSDGGGLYASIDAWGRFRQDHPDVGLIAYEGGQHLLQSSGGADAKLAAQRDPRMATHLVANYQRWAEAGGGLAFYYTLVGPWTGYGYWGLSQDVEDETGPKWDAVRTLLGGP